MKYIIGIDDHDSPNRGCTTHFATNLIKILYKNKIKLLDFPYLIRLNPNIPWKTRGNASIKLIIESDRDIKEIADIIWNTSIDYVNNISQGLKYGRKPGMAIIEYGSSYILENFYTKTVSDVITPGLMEKYIEKSNAIVHGSRGIIGSLAAIGFDGNYTFELLTYRKEENWEKERKIDLESLIAFDEKFFPSVFANVDYVKKRPLILSHGEDPVFYGIRGTDPEVLLKSLNTIQIKDEEIENFMIFKSNQGTDAHIIKPGDKIYQTFYGKVVIKNVKIIPGGDVILNTQEGFTIFIYKETGELNNAAKQLLPGDETVILGAIKPSSKYDKIIDAERLEVLSLSKNIEYRNPRCPVCEHSTESLGKDKGYRCKKCGYKFHSNKEIIENPRSISLGTYQTRAYRHLTKPLFLDIHHDAEKETKILHEVLRMLLKNDFKANNTSR
ncbi:tRNA(Ile)(2)-agmatinylcytidine synthase [Acidianus sp. HS-5]|uniref:tRNA(Ile)(2)-agmatinylcytidine synthase n=1 Tax=Acidianus sp. HS-5 TaxID=2886040 RepID=UPI001F3CC964|nr:tRNA(Ile)(2)-agmatinylcytidine synthase [Acidianus sp. HS-5]BDC19265.1 hypothetical protein HS5_21550 [Acidianus sp. HS-5]